MFKLVHAVQKDVRVFVKCYFDPDGCEGEFLSNDIAEGAATVINPVYGTPKPLMTTAPAYVPPSFDTIISVAVDTFFFFPFSFQYAQTSSPTTTWAHA